MPFHGNIVVIKRTGLDGATFPIINEQCLLGREEGCDIRVQINIVSKKHAKIVCNKADKKAYLYNLSKVNPTKLNEKSVESLDSIRLYHKDVFTIGDRKFRWEYPSESEFNEEIRPADDIYANNVESGVPTPKAKPAVPSFEITNAVKRLREDDSMTPNGRKRVSFGPYVSPEYFDKALPPSTPVRKGAVPPTETPKQRVESVRKRGVSAMPGTAGILEEGESSPKGVLRRKENDEPLIKGNSGYRTSPRISPVRTPKVSLTGPVPAIAITANTPTPNKKRKVETPKSKSTTPKQATPGTKPVTPVSKTATPDRKSVV